MSSIPTLGIRTRIIVLNLGIQINSTLIVSGVKEKHGRLLSLTLTMTFLMDRW